MLICCFLTQLSPHRILKTRSRFLEKTIVQSLAIVQQILPRLLNSKRTQNGTLRWLRGVYFVIRPPLSVGGQVRGQIEPVRLLCVHSLHFWKSDNYLYRNFSIKSDAKEQCYCPLIFIMMNIGIIWMNVGMKYKQWDEIARRLLIN